jgi:hypothetical protein
MTITAKSYAGSKVSYVSTWTDTSTVADDGEVVVTHAKDTDYVRQVSIVNLSATPDAQLNLVDGTGVSVVYTSSTTTTVKNLTGGAKLLKIVISVSP